MMIWDMIVSVFTSICGFFEMALYYTLILPFGVIAPALLQENLEQLLKEWEQLAPVIEPILEFLYKIP